MALDATLLSRVEDAGLNASAPPQQRWLDGWLLRFSPGKAKRARCINAVATGRLPVAVKLALAADVYAGTNLPLIVRITPFTLPTDLDGQLEGLGLQRFDDTRVMVRTHLDDPAPAASPEAQLRSVGLEAFAQNIGALRGSPLAQRQAHGQRLVNAPVPFSAFELQSEGERVACGQYALEGDLVGLYDVFTAPQSRGRGYATRLCVQMLAHAQARGARHAYLQVDGDNHAARAVYARLGFIDAFAYHYRANDLGTP